MVVGATATPASNSSTRTAAVPVYVFESRGNRCHKRMSRRTYEIKKPVEHSQSTAFESRGSEGSSLLYWP